MKRRKEISLLLVIAMILSVFSQSALAAPSANRPAVWDEGSVLTTTDGDIFASFDGESHVSENIYGWHIAKADVFNLKHERHRPFLVHHQRVELVVYLLLYWID